MSLLDPIAACEAVLETVMTQEIVLANRSDCPADALIGTGTALNPYNALGSPGASDPPFDQIMRALGPGKTVRLLPGTYYTRGFPVSGSAGWRPPNQLRLIGSGMRTTTLKRCDAIVSAAHAVIGNDYSNYSQFIDGLEVSDLCIDATHAGPSGPIVPSLSGIAVSGRNILVKRVRVTNFGNNSGSNEPSFGISVARVPSAIGPSDPQPDHCTVVECVLDTPGASASGPLYGIHLGSESEGKYHRFCTVRDCFVNLGQGPATYPNDFVGIAVGGGIGTIIEHNRFLNCKYGLRFPNLLSTKDLTARNNYFRQTPTGLSLVMKDALSTARVGRVALLNNVIEWPAASDFSASASGIYIEGKSSDTFQKLVVRDNVMRRWNNATSTADYGIQVINASDLIVASNLTDVGTFTKGLQTPNSITRPKPFNNATQQGTLVQAFNPDSGSLIPELETVLRDVDMALFKG